MSTGFMDTDERSGTGAGVTGRLGRLGGCWLPVAVVVVVGWVVAACSTEGGSERLAGDPELRGSEGEVVDAREEPEDACWDGALDGEPEACFVLEQAEADGALQVEAVYEAPSGPLYVMLAQSEEVDEDLLWVLREKFFDYVVTPGGAAAYNMDAKCDGYVDLESCAVDLFGEDHMYFRARQGASLFSIPTSTHDDVLLLAGGFEGRKIVPGWGSWSQRWPKTDGATGLARPASTVGPLDVSDVDTVSGLADEDCESYPHTVPAGACAVWRNFREWGYVGRKGPSVWLPGERNVVYVQLKGPIVDIPGFGEEGHRELELSLIGQGAMDAYGSGELAFEYIEVKYDLGELWRWAVILDRFTYSQANTVGITNAELRSNGVGPERPQDYRVAIAIWALDPQAARAALPEILPALGIPVDAVAATYRADTDLRQYVDVQPAPSE